ncbi:TIGR04372 family glycosyltransferase [Microcoleus sp. A006_D1]|uniref:TIGR04372 family glycosyltransferase n=1 Tax=Microcoleus sp. A006_D1 TaxID=3055267 RepID=UPI002FD193DB
MKIQAESNFQRANKLKHDGKWDESITFYQRAIEENPNFHWSYHGLAESLAKIGRLEDAIISYKRAIEINPNFFSSYHNLGDVCAKMGNWHQAIPAYCRAIELNQKYYGSYKKLGDCLYQVAIELGSEFSPSFLEKHKQILEILFPGEATQYSRDSLSISDDVFLRSTNSKNDETFIEEVYRTYFQRQADEGGKINHLNHLSQGMTRKELIHTFKNSQEFNQTFIFSIKEDYLHEAITNYRLAIELNPNFAKSYEDLAKTLNQLGKVMANQGKLEQARELYQEAINVDPNLIEPYYEQGNILVKYNKINEALESYKKAIAIKPDWAEAYVTIGDALLQQGKLEDAIQSYEKTIALKPEWDYPYLLRGHALRHLDKLQAARKSYEQAITLNSNSCWSYFHLGAVLDEMNLQEATKDCWEKMLAINTNFIGAYFSIAYHYYFKGDQDEWEKWMKKAYQIQSDLARLHQFDQLGIRFLYDGWTHAIGHTALIDFYLKLGMLGWRSAQHTILLVGSQNIANPCYLDYWKSYIEIVFDSASIDGFPDKVNFLKDMPISLINLPDGRTIRYGEALALVQKQWEEEHRDPLLAISPEDYERGWKYLRLLGVPKDAWFVSLHVRTDGFHKEGASHLSQIRSADINTYLEAIEFIVAQGGWVIRLGDSTMEPLPPMKQVIDYAHNAQKADYMDVFLCGSCRFFIGTASGMSFVSPTFGVPCVLTNWTPMGLTSPHSQDIFIPKLYWSETEQRYLSFSEFMSTPISSIYYTKKLLKLGIRIVDNAPNEIKNAVLEMLNRCNGILQYTEKDQILQQKFKNLSKKCNSYGNSRVGRDFLAHYAHLLRDDNQIIQKRLAILQHPTQKAEYYYNLANSLIEDGSLAEAIECYHKAIEFNPNLAEAYYCLANIQKDQKRFTEAIKKYEKVISLKPELIENDAEIINIVDAIDIDTVNTCWNKGDFHGYFKIVKLAMSFQLKLAEIKKLTRLGLQFFLADWVGNIGHIALIDIYIKMGILGWRSVTQTILLTSQDNITNKCFLKYWNPYITVISDPVLINSLLPLATYLRNRVGYQCCKGQWMYHSQVGGLVQRQWEKENRSPLLTLSVQDYDKGWECLHNLGLPKNGWFVTLHVREWSSQGYAPSRRGDINTYLLAIKSITALGGWVVRIGDGNMPPLLTMPQVIDLAHSDLNNELMNVFVLSQCRFLLGMPSAPYFVALTFGVPCVLTNWSQLGFRPWSSRDIFISKLFLNKTKKSYLTFAETIEKIGFIEKISHLDSLDIKQIDNTPEQINDVVLEMLERLDGKLNYMPEDDHLQQKFDAIAESYESYGSARVGRSFLREYAYLLTGGESS